MPNYTADLQPGAWIESYEMAMELLEVSDAAMGCGFTILLLAIGQVHNRHRLLTRVLKVLDEPGL